MARARVTVYSYTLSTWEVEAEFEASLDYIATTRPARATEEGSDSENKVRTKELCQHP